VAGKAIWVIGSDTVVLLDNKVFGKPRNEADAFAMLSKLSGAQHEVMTSIAVVYDGEVFSALTSTQVQFKSLSKDEIMAYIKSEEPFGKAGSYAIQGLGAKFIQSINGSYSAVMGLPLYELNQLLVEAGFDQNAS